MKTYKVTLSRANWIHETYKVTVDESQFPNENYDDLEDYLFENCDIVGKYIKTGESNEAKISFEEIQ